MLRDKSLIPLSHQHQHALALCVRIQRASPVPVGDIPQWQAEIVEIFRSEISIHFEAEEQIIFPAAEKFTDLQALVRELIADHSHLRRMFSHAAAGNMSPDDVSLLAQRLSAHIRKEERHLFERLQQMLAADELNDLGSRLQAALKEVQQSCVIPSDATRLRPAK